MTEQEIKDKALEDLKKKVVRDDEEKERLFDQLVKEIKLN